MRNLSLASHYIPAAEGNGTYQIHLTNHSDQPLTGFTLGISGPGRLGIGATLNGGNVVDQLGTWAELAPPKGFVLRPGTTWTVTASGLDFPLRHWTDGTASGMVKLADGSVHAIATSRGTAEGATPNRDGIIDLTPFAAADTTHAIIPWPAKITTSGHRTAPEGFAITGHDAVAETFTDLTTHLFPGEALTRPASENGYPVTLTLQPGHGTEAYIIAIAKDAATITASTDTGLLYGLITLAQMARGAKRDPQRFAFPTAATINDAPAYLWRGCHWDAARRFYATGEVAQFLRIMAWNKLNRFHWHLTEDEAWRVEIDAYPELCEKGAWRGYGMALPPLLGAGPERSGGYYTKDAVRGLVALGTALGIDIVPEIDLPGHCYAMLTAMPHLRDPQENGLYHSIQAFPNNALNPALPQVYDVVVTIIAELCDLFPSPYFHIGADEVPHDAWQSSPRAQAMIKAIGGTGKSALQADFLNRLQAFLVTKDKITGAWEEAAQGGGIDKSQCYLVGWQTVQSNRDLAAEGYDVVVAPAQRYYLDMANSAEWAEPGAEWAAWTSPQMTYDFDPCGGWSKAEKARLLGVQACIWCEPTTDRAAFQRLVFPRLSAIAETGWTPLAAKSWPRFAACAHLMPSLYPVGGIG